jgi:hypothetical protein
MGELMVPDVLLVIPSFGCSCRARRSGIARIHRSRIRRIQNGQIGPSDSDVEDACSNAYSGDPDNKVKESAVLFIVVSKRTKMGSGKMDRAILRPRSVAPPTRSLSLGSVARMLC